MTQNVIKLAGLVLLGGLLLGIGTAMAADPAEDTPRVHRMEEITVIATQPGVEITTDKTIINMDEFRLPGTVRTLTDVLNEIGGIDVQRINPLMASPGDEVSIRGLNEGRMVIEIDGRRINQTGHNGRYIVDWSTLNMDDIERIEIIRGGHSVLHPFAIGGVINIITKKGHQTRDPKPELSLRGGYGHFNTHSIAAGIDGGFADLIGYHFSASDQETDGYLRNNYQDTQSYNGHLTFFLPGGARLELGAKHSNVDYGFPMVNDPTRFDYDSSYPDFIPIDADYLRHTPTTMQFPGGPIPHWTKKTTYLDAILRVPLGPGDVKLHTFHQEGRRWISSYSGTNFNPNQRRNDRTMGTILEYGNIRLGNRHRVTAGLEYQELGDPPGNPRIYIVKSAYMQDVISLGDRWRLTPGVRYYHVDMDTYYPWFEQGLERPAFPTTGKTQSDDGFYPSLKVDFQATRDTALYAAVSRSYRLPCP